jgi:hypothetical protein
MDGPFQFGIRKVFLLTAIVAVGCVIVPPTWNGIVWVAIHEPFLLIVPGTFAIPIIDLLRK